MDLGLDEFDGIEELEQDLSEFDEDARKAAANEDFHSFAKRFWSIVEPERQFVDNWHIRLICKKLEDVYYNRIRRLIINVPPGTMKSLLVSVLWPAWVWGRARGKRFLTASYGAHLSNRDNEKFKTIINSDEYKRIFKSVQLRADATVSIANTERGWRIATSVKGVGTGLHPDYVIVDDPQSAEQARSQAERETCNNWFDGTISTRGVVRNVAVIIVMQRLHEADLTGHLIEKWEKGTFVHLMLPMKLDLVRKDPHDPRTTQGELLWPELFTALIVRQMEIDLQEKAPGQLQQDPTPPGGTLFKRAWFKPIAAAEVPKGGVTCRGWDIAATENGGDWTTGIKIKKVGECYYILDVVRGQWTPADVDANMLQTARLDGPWCRQREEKEPGAAGKAVIAARQKLLKDFDYQGVQLGEDKVTRSRPFRAECERGNVYIVISDTWNSDFLNEYEKFPAGKNDDQIDGGSCTFNDLKLGPGAMQPRPAMWG